MKNKLFTTLFAIGITCATGYALPVGNAADPSLLQEGIFWESSQDTCCPTWCNAISFRLGFYGDYVYNRHMQVASSNQRSAIEETKIFTNAALLVANFYNRLDLFATLGASNFSIDTNASSFLLQSVMPLEGARFTIDSQTDFSWSVGARGVLWQCGCTFLGLEGQYFCTQADITTINLYNEYATYPDTTIWGRYREWQVGIGLAHTFYLLTPYAALKWSGCSLDFNTAITTIELPTNVAQLYTLDNQRSFGYALGVTLVGCDRVDITAELRFSDEKAVHINGQLRF